MGFRIDDKKLKRAGLDYWRLLDIVLYESLSDFFAKNSGNFFYFTSKARRSTRAYRIRAAATSCSARETAGLPEELLAAHPESCVRIPMIPDSRARCLNLSNSVAVGAYEALRQWDFPGMQTAGELTRLSWD